MNNENTGRDGSAPPRVLSELEKQVSELKKQVSDFAAQRVAISEVLRAIANSPHDLQPILQTIIDSAVRLCRAEDQGGVLRVVDEAGLRLVAQKLTPALLAVYSPPILHEHGSFAGRLFASKTPVHIPDLAAEINRAGEADRISIAQVGSGTALFVPMLRNDELIGSFGIGRQRIEPFTENEIELITDFAAQAAIALEITRRERQLRELQMGLAHANRVVTVEHLTASITHEVNQPIAAARNNASAALNFLDRNPPDLQEVREALASVVKDTERAGAVVGRMRALMQNASARTDRLDINEAVREAIELTLGEALKSGVSVETQFTEGLPIITGDRVQLQQVVLNLVLNAVQAMEAASVGVRQLLITTSRAEVNDLCVGVQNTDLCVGVQDTGPGLSPETLSRLFEPFYTTKPNGMGMGLAICRSIVEAHGGRLRATACHPHGALFQFTIPARPV